MTQIEFVDFLERVAAYFGARTLMSEQRIALFYDQARHVPREALDWIERRLYEQQDSMPRNLPKVVKALWLQWQDTHPERMVSEHIECDAPGCEGGYIFVRHREGWTAVAYCDRCAVRRRLCPANSPALSNVQVLEREGYQWDSLEGVGV